MFKGFKVLECRSFGACRPRRKPCKLEAALMESSGLSFLQLASKSTIKSSQAGEGGVARAHRKRQGFRCVGNLVKSSHNRIPSGRMFDGQATNSFRFCIAWRGLLVSDMVPSLVP